MTIKALQSKIRGQMEELEQLMFQANKKDGGYSELNNIESKENRLKMSIESLQQDLEEQMEECQAFATSKRYLIISNDGRSVVGNKLELYSAQVESIIIPEGVEVVEEEAFKNCPYIRKITLPSTLRIIKREAFANCVNLSIIEGDVTSSLEEIGEMAFFLCDMLSLFTAPKTLRKICKSAFEKAGLGLGITLNTSENLHTIEERAFRASRIPNFPPPETLKRLGQSAFERCGNLRTAYLTKNILVTPKKCFFDCPKLDMDRFLEHQDYLVAEILTSKALQAKQIFLNSAEVLDKEDSKMATLVFHDVLWKSGNTSLINTKNKSAYIIGVKNADELIEHSYVSVKIGDDFWNVDILPTVDTNDDVSVVKNELPIGLC